jgi:lipid II:glycine glycyltransferase (peptidoglycan interpeptide bridge formation enzyme)
MTNTDILQTGADPKRLAAGLSLLDNGHAPPKSNATLADGQVAVRAVTPDRFDGLAANYNEVVQEQTARFLAARWGGERIETVTIERSGIEIGAAAVLVVTAPMIDRGIAVIKWGPLWRKPGAIHRPSDMMACLAALKQEYAEHRGYQVAIMPHADPVWSELAAAALEQLGFKPGPSLSAPARYLVNVGLNVDELRASLDQKWRYNLKKAGRHDLEIDKVGTEDGLARFMALYESMTQRKKFKDTSAITTLPALMSADTPALKPIIVMARHDGADTAGAVIDISGERAVYLYGATDNRALPLKAGYALHWWIAEYLCARGNTRWYDLGGSDDDQGLHQFKKGFVGKQGEIEITPPAYHYCSSTASAIIAGAIYRLRGVKEMLADLKHRVRA